MRRYFIAGLIVWVPIIITFVVIRFIIRLLDRTLSLLPAQYQPDQLFGIHIPGLGLIFTLLILLLTGLLVTNFIGHRLVNAWEKLLSRIPLIRSIHAAVKQVLHAILQPQSKSFRKVLLVEYPRKGLWSVAFQTSERFNISHIKSDTITIFIPTTPNPTSGFLMLIAKEDAIELDISVEEALRMVISLGVVMPDHIIEQNQGAINGK